jgi:hypothetical protein
MGKLAVGDSAPLARISARRGNGKNLLSFSVWRRDLEKRLGK